MFALQPVASILLNDAGMAEGVETEAGVRVYGDNILSNCTPHTTLLQLLPPNVLPKEYETSLAQLDYTSPVCKINGKWPKNLISFNLPIDSSASENHSSYLLSNKTLT